MQAGLLESLRKYRPREKSNPLENFITEAFAWVLRNNSSFSEHILEKIMNEPSMNLPSLDRAVCEWETQENFDGVFPDMVCMSNNYAIVFEHKVWSELHNNQLENYRRYADKSFTDSKVVLIAATKYQHSQDPDLALCWRDIYKWIDEWLDKTDDDQFIISDFQRLLKSEGLGPRAPISHDSIMYYYSSTDLKSQIGKLVKNVENKEWEALVKEGYSLRVDNKKRLAHGESAGRIGLHILDGWKPGIFIGFLVDGADHRTKPIDATKGPDFCLILDFHRTLHELYPKSAKYKALVDSLRDAVCKLGDNWQLYDHLSDKTANDKNYWHPIHIRKSMLDVFKGSLTADEQAQIFYSEAGKLIGLVNEQKHFWELRNELVIKP